MNYFLKELNRHRWRTVAGISGYLVAAIFILIILSVSFTTEKDSVGILKSTGTHFIVYIPSSSSCCPPAESHSIEGSLIAEGGYTLMLNSDLIYSLREIAGIKEAAPYLLYSIFDKKYNCNISLGGIDTSSIATRTNVCAPANLVSGQYLTGNPGEVVAEQSFAMAHKLYAGDTLNTYGSRFVIRGIVNSGIRPGKADIYAPIEEVRHILRDNLNSIPEGFDMNIILVEVTDSRLQNSVIALIKERMNYLSVSSYNCYQPASEVMHIMQGTSTLLSLVVFIFLLVFSAKTQLTTMMERYREIGIMKSLGWSDSKLSLQLLSGSLFQSLAGSILGVILGVLLIFLLNSNDIMLFNSMQFSVQPGMIPLIVALSVGGGIIATIFPVMRLHRIRAGDMINSYN